MFHQVFICETSQEVESATTEMLVEVDNPKPESLPCEEGINVKIEEENFKIEPEQSVVISTDHQIKLEVKKQPVVEEPMEVLSSPVPEGDTKVSRRKHSLKKSSVKKTNNGKSSSVYNNMYNNEQQENTNIGLKDVEMKRMAIQEVVQELKQIRDCEKNILRQYLNTVDSLSNSQVEYNDSLTLPTMKKEIKIITNSNVECITSDVIPPNNEEKTLHKTKEERDSSPSPSHEDDNDNNSDSCGYREEKYLCSKTQVLDNNSKNLQKTNKTWEDETNSKTNLNYSQKQSNNSSKLPAMEKQCKLINNSVDVIPLNNNGGETLYNIKEEETDLSPPSHEDDSDSCSDGEEEYLCSKKQISGNISKSKQKTNKTFDEKINSKMVIVYSSGDKTDSEMRKLKRSTKTLSSHLPKEKICDKFKVLKLSLSGNAESCRNLEQDFVPSTHNYVGKTIKNNRNHNKTCRNKKACSKKSAKNKTSILNFVITHSKGSNVIGFKPSEKCVGKTNNHISPVSKTDQDTVSSEHEEIFKKKLLICYVCKKVFDSQAQYHCHIKYSLCTGYRRRQHCQCDVCGKLFTSAEKLQDHMNSHLNARPHKCSDCGKGFNSKGARITHYKKVHQNKKILYLCCYCGITSKVFLHLLAHEETHRLSEGEEIPTPFKCLECGKGFISRFKLNTHSKKHRFKKCPQCSKEFRTQGLLTKHLENDHGVIKSYTCNICNKVLKSAESLRCHVKTHSAVMKFFCEICDKGFTRKHYINQHMITHSDLRPISCPKCDECFKRKTHLKQHMASAHGEGRK